MFESGASKQDVEAFALITMQAAARKAADVAESDASAKDAVPEPVPEEPAQLPCENSEEEVDAAAEDEAVE